ncbi:MAG: hypothetical protein Q8O34_12190 [Rhodocyclaceae bacterium]|nr:hypothetical protein [Rhodocyclaceae bacterium]
MALPVGASVEATPNFLATLREAHVFFVAQDADTADARFHKLKTRLREMAALLSWSPASGRRARFFNARSIQARMRAEAVSRLAEQAGLPNLREHIVDRHIVLYAHSDTEVVLLALKHQRQLTYGAEP